MLKLVEAFIQVKRDDCNVTIEARKIDTTSKIARLRIGQEKTTHLVQSEMDSDKLFIALQRKGVSPSRVGKNSVWVESKSCSACHAIANSELIVLSSKSISEDIVVYRVLAKSEGNLRKVVEQLNEKGMEPQVSLYDVSKDLTARESEIIYEVYAHGFFDQMRKASLTEIARNLGISTATLSESLRRTLRKIVRGYLENTLLEEMKTD